MKPWDELSAVERQTWLCTLLGWTELHVEDVADLRGTTRAPVLCGRKPDGVHARDIAPDPLRDANDALRVVEAMRERHFDFECDRERDDRYYRVVFTSPHHVVGSTCEATFPAAVCRAAYEAIGGET